MTSNQVTEINWPAEYSPQRMPILITNELYMAASAESIFALLADAEKWPTYYFNASDVKILTQGEKKLSKGTRFKWKTFGVSIHSRVMEFVLNERIGWDGHGIGMAGYHGFTIKKLDVTHCYVLTEETQRGLVARIGKAIYPTRTHDYHQLWLQALEKEAQKNMSRDR